MRAASWNSLDFEAREPAGARTVSIATPSETHPFADRAQRFRIGIVLAATIIASWLALHIYAVFFFEWSPSTVWLAPVIAALLCWLYVGLFIIAHDCMHGSLAPGNASLNRWIGQLCVGIYAGFSYRQLLGKHIEHHRYSGTAEDPDFAEPQPTSLPRWYWKFMTEYLSVRMFAFMAAQSALYVGVFGAHPLNMAVFWVIPAVLSSLQLFYFGTYLPHRHEDDSPFADRHHARSNAYPPWLSLLTCYHFGYHHEHHLKPGEPWWRLPAVRRTKQLS
jgi:beta-carotene/zeaxanthin 4-ketolase